MSVATQQERFEAWKQAHKKMLDDMFTGELPKSFPKEKVKEGINTIWEIRRKVPKRYIYDHSTLTKSIARYFFLPGWGYRFEVPFANLEFNRRFDIVARQGDKTIIAEVKPQIDAQDFGQILAYLLNLKKANLNARVFLGTDILNFGRIFGRGETRDIILDMADKYRLGVILASKEQTWLIPAEFLLV